ncbi:MAG: hypothetical protein IKZ22_06640, partial [Kiritimatiellae bacterium]|nr:hypothetical protein [Kiritimatiellia bacterium]
MNLKRIRRMVVPHVSVFAGMVFGGDPYAYKELTVTPSRPVEIRKGLFDFGKDGIGWLELNGEPAGEYVLVLGEMTNAEGRVANPFPES